MKNLITKKLKSSSGASLSFALLFFIMCATIGSIILVAATTASGRLKNLQEDDQTYFATSSAAELVEDMMSEAEVSITLTPESITYAPANTLLTDVLHSHILRNIQPDPFNYDNVNVIRQPNEYIGFAPVKRSFTITVDSSQVGENASSLESTVTMWLDKELNLIAEIRPTGADHQGLNNLVMTLKPTIKISEEIIENDNNRTVNSDERETSRRKIVSLTWKNPVLQKGVGE